MYIYEDKKYDATAMESDFVKQLLKEYSFCGLFTDLKNPISNKIYQKIGFYPIYDFLDIEFTKSY